MTKQIIDQARAALSRNDTKEALKVLKPLRKTLKDGNVDNLNLIQVFSETYLEDGQLERAYPLLVQACELDPDGSKGGSDKFFTLGQVLGGQDGIQAILRGIANISTLAGDNLNQEQVDKIASGLLSMIEIWMTDLCMEPHAEMQCEELISKAMEVTERNSAEVWSTMGSIRISQQRFSEACEAFTQSWELFDSKCQLLTQAMITEEDTHGEFLLLLQPLLSLAKMCLEVGLYETSLKINSRIQEIDEDNIESFYLEGFTNYLLAKLETFKMQNPEVKITPESMQEFNQTIQDIPLNHESEDIQELILQSRIALSYVLKLKGVIDPNDELSTEILAGSEAVLAEIGGPLDDNALAEYRKPSDDVDDEEEFETLIQDA